MPTGNLHDQLPYPNSLVNDQPLPKIGTILNQEVRVEKNAGDGGQHWLCKYTILMPYSQHYINVLDTENTIM
jgi:hypothetical protein